MDSKHLWLIAPHTKLAEEAQVVCQKLNFDLEIRVGNLYSGVELAKQAVKHGAEVIISRGGTAELIRQAVDVPVVEIRTTGFDLLKALYPLKDYHGTIAAIGFKNVVFGAQGLGETLNLEVKEIMLSSREQIIVKISEVMDAGISIIIGDTDVVNKAKDAGIETRLISFGKEAIVKAVEEAFRIIKIRQIEQAKAKELKTIVDNVKEGIISIDEQGIVNVFNSMAEHILDEASYKVLGKNINVLVPELETPKQLQSTTKVVQVKGKNVILNVFPVEIDSVYMGAIVTLQEVNKLTKLEHQVRREIHSKGLVATKTFNDILGNSRALFNIINKAKKYSTVDSTILIIGESGTGKEVFAQSIHNSSRRENGPFVAINCAALPENLLESELFGYEKGAFTGASEKGKMGLFELAHGGTLFLDEVGEMPLGLQAKLLRVLQERQVLRIGGQAIIPIDVRIIAATNKDLSELVGVGSFREDLFYRLNVLSLFLPPLRERQEDIALLTEKFKETFVKEQGCSDITLTKDALLELTRHHWKGNIRELANFMERIVLLFQGETVNGKLVKELLSNERQEIPIGINLDQQYSLQDLEKEYITQVIVKEKSKTKVAELLGINRVTLWRKLQQYGIEEKA